MTTRIPTPVSLRPAKSIGQWYRTTDVLVVGLGCAGAAAAIDAALTGASVLAVERAGEGGGTSALSGGLIYMGGGTPVQKACGFDDTAEEMFKFLMAACGPGPDEEKIRLYCEHSVEQFEWLVARGVPFKNTYYPEPGREPPTDDCLLYSGGEDGFPFEELARPAPRAHKPRVEGAAGGFLMHKLLAAATTAGVEMLTNACARDLIIEEDGRVRGLIVHHEGKEHALRARGGVILTAGGFIKNKAMVTTYAPVLRRGNYRLGVDGDDGWAIRAGLLAGGAAIRMEAGSVSIPLYPPKNLMRGILVNEYGQRFINEDSYFGRTGQAILYKQEGKAFLIVDANTYVVNAAGMQAMEVQDSLAELGQRLGMPAGALERTMAAYNVDAEHGTDSLFHKSPKLLQPLTKAPYAAIGCGTDNAIYAVFTLGGLRTRPDGEVLTADGAVVPGLYAAGATTSGLCAFGYCSGLSLSGGMFFGRLAGRQAAAAARPDKGASLPL